MAVHAGDRQLRKPGQSGVQERTEVRHPPIADIGYPLARKTAAPHGPEVRAGSWLLKNSCPRWLIFVFIDVAETLSGHLVQDATVPRTRRRLPNETLYRCIRDVVGCWADL